MERSKIEQEVQSIAWSILGSNFWNVHTSNYYKREFGEDVVIIMMRGIISSQKMDQLREKFEIYQYSCSGGSPSTISIVVELRE